VVNISELNLDRSKYSIINNNTYKPHIRSNFTTSIPMSIIKNFISKPCNNLITVVEVSNKDNKSIRFKKMHRTENSYIISYKKEKLIKNPKIKIIDIIPEKEALIRENKKESSEISILSIMPKSTGLTPIYAYQLNNLKVLVGGYYKKDIIFNKKIRITELASAALGLYFAEGGKKAPSFTNSDPSTINIILDFIESISNLRRKDISASIYCHPKLKKKEKQLKAFWKTQTGIEKFTKLHLSRKSRSPCGTLEMNIGSIILKELFLKLLDVNIPYDNNNFIRGVLSGDGSPIKQTKTFLTHHISLNKKTLNSDFLLLEKIFKNENIKIKCCNYPTTAKLIIYSDWFKNINLIINDIYKFNLINRLKFIYLFLNLQYTKAFMKIKDGYIIKGIDIARGQKKYINVFKKYELIKLKQISPKPNKKYKIIFTKEGREIRNIILKFQNNYYPMIRKEFLNFCRTLRKFDLLDKNWYKVYKKCLIL